VIPVQHPLELLNLTGGDSLRQVNNPISAVSAMVCHSRRGGGGGGGRDISPVGGDCASGETDEVLP
jgi:hypothetical protein